MSKFIDDLRLIFSEDSISIDREIREEKSLDKSPRNLFGTNSDSIASVVVKPSLENYKQQLKELVLLSIAYDKYIVVRGGGSGVCGAAVPRFGQKTIIVDMTGLNSVVFADSKMSVTIGAGILGSELETILNEKDYTLGHSPASLAISTPGGWVATRSNGQFSSRYGNIENLVRGIEIIDSNGDCRWVSYDQLNDYLRMEGTTGIITRVKLSITSLPKFRRFKSYQFSHIGDGLEFLEKLKIQRHFMENKGVYLSAVRLYDFLDWRLFAKPHKKVDMHGPSKLKIIFEKIMVRLPKLSNKLLRFWEIRSDKNCFLLVVLESDNEQELNNSVRVIDKLVETIGIVSDSKFAENWYQKRYDLNYEKVIIRFKNGIMVDTFECQGDPKTLRELYLRLKFIMRNDIVLCSHFGIDRDNFYAYFTFAGRKNLDLHRYIWETFLDMCIRLGVLTTHHHGIGSLKAGSDNSKAIFGYGENWYKKSKDIKNKLDPQGIFNPGNIY